ncbi:MAG: phosphotransferase [Patescibacteria group bacterium]|jgi:thiamine kinase-like enzyme
MKLSEKTKQQMAKLVIKDFVIKILNERLPKHYKDFKKIKSLSLTPFKKHLGITSAVFVVEYKIKYISKDGSIKDIDIFVSAHSDGSRKEAYQKTRTLYKHGFDTGKYRVTKPLFFLAGQKAFFYVSSPGASFFSFFTQDISADLKKSMRLITGWIKKLHSLDLGQLDFKWPVFDILAMVPAPKKFIKDFYNNSNKLGKNIEQLVTDLHTLDNKYRKKISRTLIYGDFHPENIIIKNLEAREIEMIDFTDIATGDPMMDIGTFIQQLDFMGHNFVSRKEINQHKKDFVEIYFKQDLEDINIEYINRINIYQSWTAMRSAVFLFYMKDVVNPIDDLLQDAIEYLNLAKNSKRSINVN